MSPGTQADWLCSFFVRLEPLAPVVRILIGAEPLSAQFLIRAHPERSVTLDFRDEPARILVDDSSRAAAVRIAASDAVLHRVLAGELPGGEAFGRRELLFRGAASDLARLIPLLGFAPLLYRDHLADLGLSGFARSRKGGGPHRIELEDSMHERPSSTTLPTWHGLRMGSERALARTVSRLAYAAGYGVGLLRHRYLERLSLFDVLAELARGVEDARAGSRRRSERPAA